MDISCLGRDLNWVQGNMQLCANHYNKKVINIIIDSFTDLQLEVMHKKEKVFRIKWTKV